MQMTGGAARIMSILETESLCVILVLECSGPPSWTLDASERGLNTLYLRQTAR